MDVPYMLVDFFEPGGLWERRCNLDHPFASDGAFAGKKFKVNAANPPWRWNDSDDGDDIHTGAMAFDPAYMISRYFNGVFSQDYIDPRYIPFICDDTPPRVRDGDIQARYYEALQLAVKDNIASIDVLMEAVMDPRMTWEARKTLTHQAGNSKAFKAALTGAIKSLFDAVLDPPNARGIGKKLMESFNTLSDAVSIFYLSGLLQAPVLEPYLMEAYKFGKEYTIQYSSGQALTNYTPQNPAMHYSVVRQVMNSYNVGVRGVSAQLYGRWYAQNDVRPLARLMYDDQPAIRWQAVDATNGVRTSETRAVLAQRATGDDLYATTRAAQLLVDNYGPEGLESVRQSHPEAYKYAAFLVAHPNYDLSRDFSATPTDAESDQRLQLVMSITDALSKLRPEINPRRDIDIEM